MDGNTGGLGEVTAGTSNVTVANLATTLELINTITFTVCLISLTSTKTYRRAGLWIKMLLENATLIDIPTTGKYVNFITNSFTLHMHGYDMIYILQGLFWASAMDNLKLVPTDILWSLLITNGPRLISVI